MGNESPFVLWGRSLHHPAPHCWTHFYAINSFPHSSLSLAKPNLPFTAHPAFGTQRCLPRGRQRDLLIQPGQLQNFGIPFVFGMLKHKPGAEAGAEGQDTAGTAGMEQEPPPQALATSVAGL